MNKFRELAKKLTPEQNRLWAIACAELVLPIFEDKYPNDNRPRLAIEAAKNKSPDAARAAVFAARAAAYAAEAAYAIYAAHAADAAYYAAYYAEQAGASKEEILQLGENIREQV
jgi:hypothetical protein